MSTVRVVTTPAYEYLALRIMSQLGLDRDRLLVVERKQFADGEHYYRLMIERYISLINDTVIYVGGTTCDDEYHDIFRIGGALAKMRVLQTIFVIPFFGYQTMERAVKPGEVVTAKAMARLLSRIPNARLGNTFLLFDTHTPGLVHYFEGDCVAIELPGDRLLREAIPRLGLTEGSYMFASADLGRPQRIQDLAEHYGTKIALVWKTRKNGKTHVEAVIGDVRGKTVVMYDDMSRSLGTTDEAAEAYLSVGAVEVITVLSHFALNNAGVMDRLIKSPIKRWITTDSHHMSQLPAVKANPNIWVLETASVFARTIQKLTTF